MDPSFSVLQLNTWHTAELPVMTSPLNQTAQKQTLTEIEGKELGLENEYSFQQKQELANLLVDELHFSQASESEKQFLLSLTLQNIGNLFGRQFIKNKHDRFGCNLEGYVHRTEPLLFLLQGIELIAAYSPELYGEQQREAAHRLRSFLPVFKLFDKLHLTAFQSPDKQVKLQAFGQWLAEVREKLQTLPISGQLLLPWGCELQRNKELSLLLLFTKQKNALHLQLINSGKGLHLHPTSYKNKKRVYEAVKNYAIPNHRTAEWEAYLDLLFEPLFFFETSFEKPMDRYTVEELYDWLEPFAIATRTSSQQVTKKNTCCAIRSLGLAFNLFGGNWPELKFALSRQILRLACSYSKTFCQLDSLYNSFFNRILQNSFRYLNRQKKIYISSEYLQRYIEQFEMYADQLKKWQTETVSTPFSIPELNDAWLNKEFLLTIQKSVDKTLELKKNNVKKASKTKKTKPLYSEPPPRLCPHTINLEQLLDDIIQASYSCYLSGEKSSQKLTKEADKLQIIRFCVKLFLDPQWGPHKEKIVAQLQENKQINQLRSALAQLALTIDWPSYLATTHLTLEGARLVVWQLTRLEEEANGIPIEERLTRYALSLEDLAAFENPPQNILSLACWYPIEEEINMIQNGYQTLINQDAQKLFSSETFTYPINRMQTGFVLGQAEHQYITLFANRLSQEEKRQAEADLKERRDKNDISSTVKADEWLLYWLFTEKKLPQSFYDMWRLSIALYVVSIKRNPYERTNNTLTQSLHNYTSIHVSEEGKLYYPITLKFEVNDKWPGSLKKLVDKTKATVGDSYSGDEDKLPLWHAPQNIHLAEREAEWHEAVSILSATNPALQLAMLLDLYSSQPFLLSSQEHRLLIGMVLTTPLLLPRAFRKLPYLIQELFEFFKMRLGRKEKELVAAAQEHQEAAEGFLLQQWAYCALACEQVDKARSEKELKEVKFELQKQLEKPQQNKKLQWQLQLSYLLCLPVVANASQDLLCELIDLFRSLSQIAISLEDNYQAIWQLEPPCYLLYEATARWQPTLQSAYDQFFDLSFVSKSLPYQKIIGVEKNDFPWLYVITEKGAFDFNAITGLIPLGYHKLQLGGTLPFYFNLGLYHMLFHDCLPPKIVGFESCSKESTQNILVQDIRTGSLFTISYRKLQDKEKMSIYREFEGKRYYLIDSRLPRLEEYFCWHHFEENLNLLFEVSSDRLMGSLDSEGWLHPADADGIKKRFAKNLPWKLPFFLKNHAILTESVDKQGSSQYVLSFDYLRTLDGNILTFIKEKERWLYSADHTYAIAKQQTFTDLKLSGNWLLLENSHQEQLLLVSLCSYDQTKKDIDSYRKLEKVIALKLDRNGALVQQNSTQANFLIAYYLIQEAQDPLDYEKAATFLKKARVFRRYNEGEAALLAKIATYIDDQNKKDEPELHALRLLGAFFLKENFSQYPLNVKERATVPGSLRASDIEWNQWADQLQKNLFEDDKRAQTLGPKLYRDVIRKARSAYLLSRNNLSRSLLLEKRFSRKQLEKYGLYREFFIQVREGFSLVPSSLREQLSQVKEIKQLIVPIELIRGSQKTSLEVPKTRPDKPFDNYCGMFFNKTLDIQAVNKIKQLQLFRAVRWKWPNDSYWFDREEKNRSLFVYLFARAISENPDIPGYELATCVTRLLNNKVVSLVESCQEECAFLDDSMKICSLFVENFLKETDPENKWIQITHPLATAKNPSGKIVTVDLLPYQPNRELYQLFHELSSQLFKESIPHRPIQREVFTQKGIDCTWLNEEFAIGVYQNEEQRNPTYHGSLKDVKAVLLGKGRHVILSCQIKDKQEQQALGQQIVAAANDGLMNHPEARIKRGAARRSFLELQDILLLCCHSDKNKIAKQLYLDRTDVDALALLVGRFCEASLRQRHADKLLTLIEELKNASDEQELLALSSLHKCLLEPYCLIDQERLTNLVMLSYQHLMGMNFRPDQIEGLNKMLRSEKGHILQMATGDGKTSVLAQLGAFAAADGDHLSVLVTPVHQFNAILPSIGKRAEDFLQQDQYAFIFEDKAPYNQLDHLYTLYQLANQAREKKAFLHTTPLTLRALRTAYIQGKLDLNNPDLNLEKNQKKELKEKTDILEQILKLFRSKGCFIFDEVDEATNPYKVYNKGVGKKTPLATTHLQLIQELVEQAIFAKDSDEKLLLPLKTRFCGRIDHTAFDQLIIALATSIVENPTWLKLLDCEQLSSQERSELIGYLSQMGTPPPQSLQARLLQRDDKIHISNQQGLELLTFLRDLLAGQAILGSLSQSFYEDYLLEPSAALPIAVPTKSHMQAAEHSEFSNPYRMVLNTFWGYYIRGISENQTEELLLFLRKRAVQELTTSTQSTLKLCDTPTAVTFARMAQAYGLNPDLFSAQVGKKDFQNKVREAINEGGKAALPLLLAFVSEYILMQKKLYTKEVSCTGMATMLMTKKSSGFTATLDQQLIAPYLDKEGNKVSIGFSNGIFGRRIDLMLSHHQELYIIDDEPKSLFSHLLHKLTPIKQSQVRAIIDGGCHFRGIDNQAVAQLICEELEKAPGLKDLKGVLFFDIHSNRPLYMHRKAPHRIEEMYSLQTEKHSGKIFYSSIGIAIEEVLVFFSSDKATGTDVPLPENAVILSTMPAKSSAGKSPFFLKIQADGRARGIDKKQQVITAVPKSLLTAMSESFEDPSLALYTGHISEGKELLKKLFIYVWGQHIGKKSDESRLLALHQMVALVQQTLLDATYEKPELQNRLFSQYRFLFEEDVSINFIETNGLPWKEIPLTVSWKKVIIAISEPLKDFIPGNESDVLVDILRKIAVEADITGSATIKLPEHQSEQEKALFPTMSSSADGQMVQAQSQSSEQQSEQEQTAVKNKISTRRQNRYNNFIKPGDKGILSRETLFDTKFASRKSNSASKNIFIGEKPKGICYSLNYVLHKKIDDWKQPLFSSRLMLSDGYLETIKGSKNLLDSYQKPPQLVLLICDKDQAHLMRVVLLSVDQAEEVAAHLSAATELYQKQKILPSNERQMWLITVHGLLAAPSPYHYNNEKIFKRSSVQKLFTQLYFLMGDWKKLEEPIWQEAFKKWIIDKNRAQLRSLFEKCIQVREGYLQSKTCALLSE